MKKQQTTQRSINETRRSGRVTAFLLTLGLAAALPWGGRVQAANLLDNPGFEANPNTGAAPLSWTTFRDDGNHWNNTDAAAHSGTTYYKTWGYDFSGGTSNVSGIYQDKAASAGSTFSADGWFYTPNLVAFREGWIDVTFRNSGGTVLAWYKSASFDYLAGYFVWIDYPVTNVCDLSGNITGSVSHLSAPAGTATVRFQLNSSQWSNAGGNVYFDDATLTQISGPAAPVVTLVYTDGTTLLQATNKFVFTAVSSGSTINNSAIQVTLNGNNISSSLVISGSASSKSVIYSGLQLNTLYTATVSVTDANNLTTTKNVSFDTFNPSLVWEAEDYDFDGGLFIDSPILASNPMANSYFGTVGQGSIDENNVASGANHFYRANDAMGTDYANDTPRRNFVAAQVADPNIRDYSLAWFWPGCWVNYTRTIPAGTYNIWGRMANGTAGLASVYLAQVTSGQGTANQTTNLLGTFNFQGVAGAWSTYNYVPLTDASSNLVAVSLSGVSTLEAVGGDANINFFMAISTTPLVTRPSLTIATSGRNAVITWPTASGAGFTLRSKTSLTGGTWAAVGTAPVTVGANYQVTLPLGTVPQFFRLTNP